jgi:hypothetical protein
MKTLLVIRSGIRPTVSINKPESIDAKSCTKPTATALNGKIILVKALLIDKETIDSTLTRRVDSSPRRFDGRFLRHRIRMNLRLIEEKEKREGKDNLSS